MSNEIAVLGGGCFWCTEAIFSRLKGVLSVTSGYCGGHVENPSYQEVCTKTTGHVEVVKIVYDANVISFRHLLEVFFNTHDPTTLNRQGEDKGPQYASVIFSQNERQQQEAKEIINEIQKEFDHPIVTQVRPAVPFWEAEDYHHEYFKLNPEKAYCSVVIAPKILKLVQKYAHYVK